MSKTKRLAWGLLAAGGAFFFTPWLGAQSPSTAAKAGVNLLLSMEGKVEVSEKRSEMWKPAKFKYRACFFRKRPSVAEFRRV